MTQAEGHNPSDPRVRDAIAEYERLLREGAAPTQQEIVDRYPDVKDQLIEYFRRAGETSGSEASVPGDNKTSLRGTEEPDPDITDEWVVPENGGSPRGGTPTVPTSGSSSTAAASRFSSEQSSVAPGQMVGEFRLVREIGRGGMGIVYEAEQVGSGRRVALKLLAPDLPRSEETVQRFLREASIAAAVSHPRSTFIYGAGEFGGQFYIAMELMPGRTLSDVVQSKGALPTNKAVDCILDVLEGLGAAHSTGVVHRDVKPSNCFVDNVGRIKVGDYGLSKSLVTDGDLTRTGSFMGTPRFAAPEQVRGAGVDQRTDIFSVGATLYFLIAGKPPYTGNATAVIAQIVADDPPSLRGICPRVPKALESIVARTLSKDPEKRYSDVGQLRKALLPFATHGVSMADVGRRLAAYFLDSATVSFAASLLAALTILTTRLLWPTGSATHFASITELGAQLFVGSVLVVYFTITDGFWGRGLGKSCFGLQVLDLHGQAPGFGRALLRALVLPGIAVFPGIILRITAFADQAERGFGDWRVMMLPQLYVAISWLLSLLCVSTMRARNGYRGLHELASGTRVVRPRGSTASSLDISSAVVPPAASNDVVQSLGPYRVLGQLGASGRAKVQHAYDDSLRRPVWLYCTTGQGSEQSPARMAVARPTRQRWLRQGETAQQHWHAYEPVEGAPLPDLIGQTGGLSWSESRRILVELAEELAASLDDGTLPEILSVEQVWLDRSGHVKLLDAPLDLPDRAEPVRAKSATNDDTQRALELLRSVAKGCSQEAMLPGHAIEFLEQLAVRPADDGSIAWALTAVRDMADRPARLGWDDRLGVLAVSWGLESTFSWIYGTMIGALLWTIPELGLRWRVFLVVVACLLPAAVLGFSFRGGFVFWLTGVEVRRRDKRLATRCRCACRNVLAWVPAALAYGLGGVMIATVSQHYGFTDAGVAVRSDAVLTAAQFRLHMVVLLIAWLASMVTYFLATIYTVLRPRRGLQDLIVATRLVPR